MEADGTLTNVGTISSFTTAYLVKLNLIDGKCWIPYNTNIREISTDGTWLTGTAPGNVSTVFTIGETKYYTGISDNSTRNNILKSDGTSLCTL